MRPASDDGTVCVLFISRDMWRACQCLLMFRSERLDFTRPAFRSAADGALDVLAGHVRAVRDEPLQATLTLPQAAQMVVAWSLVHGFAMLLLDDRLKQLIARLPAGVHEMAFLPAILSAALPKT